MFEESIFRPLNLNWAIRFNHEQVVLSPGGIITYTGAGIITDSQKASGTLKKIKLEQGCLLYNCAQYEKRRLCAWPRFREQTVVFFVLSVNASLSYEIALRSGALSSRKRVSWHKLVS